MTAIGAIDSAWLKAHPLPAIDGGLDKEERGRAVLVGGSTFVPGALRLTGEAILRVGAGKLQIATIEQAALPLGMLFPEAAVLPLATDDQGELAAGAAKTLRPNLQRCGALMIGPAMTERPQTADLVLDLLESLEKSAPALLDAGAMTAVRRQPARLRALGRRIVLTPHHGELATVLEVEKQAVAAEPARTAADAAARFGAVVVLKSAETIIADPSGELFRYQSKAPGLGTAGSGDVLAGIIGGLLARGVSPVVASGWGVWLHGSAGEAASAASGPIGFLARDLLPHLPALIAGAS
jgi:ADP-dependent NAD(P)H-hydrate dehydratase